VTNDSNYQDNLNMNNNNNNNKQQLVMIESAWRLGIESLSFHMASEHWMYIVIDR